MIVPCHVCGVYVDTEWNAHLVRVFHHRPRRVFCEDHCPECREKDAAHVARSDQH